MFFLWQALPPSHANPSFTHKTCCCPHDTSVDCLIVKKAQAHVLSISRYMQCYFTVYRLFPKYCSIQKSENNFSTPSLYVNTNKIKMLCYRTSVAFFFSRKQSTWNFKMCSISNRIIKRLEVNNAPTVTDNKTYLLEQTRYLPILMHKSVTNICKGRKSNLLICKNKSQILQVLL